jgi:AraC-like DNA-binding protein
MQPAEALISKVCREDTLVAHRRAVERVITTARERLCEPISLRDMSRVAYLSTFHFNRVFHQFTGLPPAKLIAAMRLDEAKRLLLNTNRSVTDICFEVGYNSLSTFTRRFTQRVGLGPREFRYLADRITPASVESLAPTRGEKGRATPVRRLGGRGFVDCPTSEPIFVGLFPPTYRRVARWAALPHLARCLGIGPVPDGTYHSPPPLPRLVTRSYLLPDREPSVGRNGPVVVRQGRTRVRSTSPKADN